MRIILIIILSIAIKVEAQTSTLTIADSLYNLGNYTQAINNYAHEDSQRAQLQIARAYNASGNYEKSILQYEATVDKHPKSQMARFELGKLFLKIRKPQLAAEQFFDLTLDGTKNPEYYYYLGRSLQELRSTKKAIQYLEAAFALDSTHLRSIFLLGKHYVSKKKKDLALYYIDKGLDHYSNDVSLINLKALALFNNEEYKKARPLLEDLLAKGEQKAHIYQKLAYCYFKEGAVKKAKNTYFELLDFEKAIPVAYNGLGAVYREEKKLDSAAICFKLAIKAKKPNLAMEYEALAGLARERKDLGTALKYYRSAYQEDITNYRMYYQVCTISDQYYKDPKEKLERYEKFIVLFGKKKPFFSDLVVKRISQLKEEIHLAGG